MDERTTLGTKFDWHCVFLIFFNTSQLSFRVARPSCMWNAWRSFEHERVGLTQEPWHTCTQKLKQPCPFIKLQNGLTNCSQFVRTGTVAIPNCFFTRSASVDLKRVWISRKLRRSLMRRAMFQTISTTLFGRGASATWKPLDVVYIDYSCRL